MRVFMLALSFLSNSGSISAQHFLKPAQIVSQTCTAKSAPESVILDADTPNVFSLAPTRPLLAAPSRGSASGRLPQTHRNVCSECLCSRGVVGEAEVECARWGWRPLPLAFSSADPLKICRISTRPVKVPAQDDAFWCRYGQFWHF